jgi:hypothetical protein
MPGDLPQDMDRNACVCHPGQACMPEVEHHLRELGFKRGLLESAEFGKGFKGRRYTVRRPGEHRWTDRLSFGNRSKR